MARYIRLDRIRTPRCFDLSGVLEVVPWFFNSWGEMSRPRHLLRLSFVAGHFILWWAIRYSPTPDDGPICLSWIVTPKPPNK